MNKFFKITFLSMAIFSIGLSMQVIATGKDRTTRSVGRCSCNNGTESITGYMAPSWIDTPDSLCPEACKQKNGWTGKWRNVT